MYIKYRWDVNKCKVTNIVLVRSDAAFYLKSISNKLEHNTAGTRCPCSIIYTFICVLIYDTYIEWLSTKLGSQLQYLIDNNIKFAGTHIRSQTVYLHDTVQCVCKKYMKYRGIFGQ